jgi:hypothetical protein
VSKILRALLATLGVAVIMLGFSGWPAAAAGEATITLTFATPEGVPAIAILEGKSGSYVATKGLVGTSETVKLAVAPGEYSVRVRPVMAGTKRFVGVPSRRSVQVSQGGTATVKVSYYLSEGVQEAHTASITSSKVELAWTTPPDTDVSVRRTEGDTPATRPSQGVEIAVSGSGLVDKNLKSGTRYNYSIWAKPGDSAFGVDEANGPVVLSVGTDDPSDATKPSYVVKPDTLLAKSTDLASVTPTGDGVTIKLSKTVLAPAPGTGVVLPVSSTLQGGFLGVVASVSEDGRTVELQAGGLGDAFDYYHLKVDDMSALPQISVEQPPEATEAQASESLDTQELGMTNQDKEKAHRAYRKAPKSSKTTAQADSLTALASLANELPEATVGCGSLSAIGTVIDFNPKFSFGGGHFEAKVDKYNVLGVGIPTGVSIDTDAKVTVSAALTAKADISVTCKVSVPPLMIPFSAGPVPMAFYLKPTVKVGIEDGIKVSNLGLALTLGYKVKGYVGFNGSNHFEGGIIKETHPLTPQIDAVSGGVKIKIGSELVVGAGAGSSKAGVIAGLGGEYVPLDLDAKAVIPTIPGSTPCLTVQAAYKLGIMFSARAWLGGGIEFKGDFPIPFLHISVPYPGTPWYYPSKCDTVVNPSDEVLGSGVTKVDDTVSGSSTQWGYLSGFAPGIKAWVLSTGLVSQAQGEPSFFASTALGNPGNDKLSEYSGYSTYDAAAYKVTLIPTGNTLKVQYVFASEEYPEFVDSPYNDTMAIFVNGKNCATVPGTSSPVSINTINDHTNSSYYVDNSTAASGYNTSYDGLTKPLTCTASVQPGVPVTVEIAVADASDEILDSAIALLDKGIWSE